MELAWQLSDQASRNKSVTRSGLKIDINKGYKLFSLAYPLKIVNYPFIYTQNDPKVFFQVVGTRNFFK